MPNKYAEKKKWTLKKQHYKVTNWPEYNESLRRRGAIDVWLSEDAIMNWVEEDQRPDGTGTPKHYTDFAIIICHELRQVYRLPLRQAWFKNSHFVVTKTSANSPQMKAGFYFC